jgi:hypothetical protein
MDPRAGLDAVAIKKILVRAGIRTTVVQPVACSLWWLRKRYENFAASPRTVIAQ